MTTYNFSRFAIEIENFVAIVRINNPEKANSLDLVAWQELEKVFQQLDDDIAVRAIIIKGEGKHFCSGMDLSVFMHIQELMKGNCSGRKNEKLRKFIIGLQNNVSAIEKCTKPVLAAIHGGCIGGGLDIAAACDMRYSTADAVFSIREIEIGIVADLGVLQRLPKIMANGYVREMAYTGRNVKGAEAATMGLVNRSFDTKEALFEFVQQLAQELAAKSPLSMRGTKEMLVYATEHSIADGLNYVATWNSAMMLSNDMSEAVMATMEKRKPNFE
jgi:enoyl-CoA hydratase